MYGLSLCGPWYWWGSGKAGLIVEHGATLPAARQWGPALTSLGAVFPLQRAPEAQWLTPQYSVNCKEGTHSTASAVATTGPMRSRPSAW
jgi:hypothetical protein